MYYIVYNTDIYLLNTISRNDNLKKLELGLFFLF